MVISLDPIFENACREAGSAALWLGLLSCFCPPSLLQGNEVLLDHAKAATHSKLLWE